MLIEKMEINKQHFMNNAEDHLAKRVKVSGGQVYVGQQLNKVLISAEDEAKQMGDEHLSVEHLFLEYDPLSEPGDQRDVSGVSALQENVFCRHFPRYAAISV